MVNTPFDMVHPLPDLHLNLSPEWFYISHNPGIICQIWKHFHETETLIARLIETYRFAFLYKSSIKLFYS
jgi:hypothetical protein